MKKVKNGLIVILVLFIIGYGFFRIIYHSLTDYFIKSNTTLIKAVIIDDKNYYGGKGLPSYSFSYSFSAKGKIYTNDSHDQDLSVGDSIEVIYNNEHPVFNKPLHQKD